MTGNANVQTTRIVRNVPQEQQVQTLTTDGVQRETEVSYDEGVIPGAQNTTPAAPAPVAPQAAPKSAAQVESVTTDTKADTVKETADPQKSTVQQAQSTQKSTFMAQATTKEGQTAAQSGYYERPRLDEFEDEKPNLAEESGYEVTAPAAPKAPTYEKHNLEPESTYDPDQQRGKLQKSDTPRSPRQGAQQVRRERQLRDPLPPIEATPATRLRGKKGKKAHEETIKEEVSNRQAIPTGNNVKGVLLSSADGRLGLNSVSLGSSMMLKIVTAPDNILLRRVNKQIQKFNARPENAERQMQEFTEEMFLGDNPWPALERLKDTLDLVDVWVTMTKSPTTDPQSFQARTLKMHWGDGVRVNPLAVKPFNADFDSDEATIHLDGKYVGQARTGIEYLIGIEGNCLIDWDYFPVMSFKSDKTMVNAFQRIFRGQDVTELVAAWENMVINRKEDPSTEVAFVRLFAKQCNYSARRIDKNMTAFYNLMLEAKRLAVDSIVSKSHLNIDELDTFLELVDLTEEEKTEWRYFAKAREGHLPANWAQYIVDTAGFLGEIDGKNSPFRQGAGPAKAIKRDPHVFIGPDGMYKSQATTALGLMAQVMSGKTFQEGWATTKEALTTYVIAKAGFPSDPKYAGDVKAWMVDFAEAYNDYAGIIEIVSVEVDSRYAVKEDVYKKTIDIQYDVDGKPDVSQLTFKSFVEPFIEVYGDFSMHAIFGKGFMRGTKEMIRFSGQSTLDKEMGNSDYDGRITGGYLNDKNKKMVPRTAFISQVYKHASVREFAYKNHMAFSLDAKTKSSGRKLSESDEPVIDLLLALADSRTSAAADYEKASVKAYRAMQNVLNRYHDVRKKDPTNLSFKIEMLCRNYVDVLRGTHPDMFAYFGMDNMDGFEQSKYGKAMLRGYSMDSVRIAMTYKWRRSRLDMIEEKIADAPNEEVKAVLEEKLQKETVALASSSDLWSVLATITDKQFRAYCDKIKPPNGSTPGTTLSRMTMKKDPKTKKLLPMKANANASMIRGWKTFEEFMDDCTIEGSDKRAIITDLVIEYNGWIRFNPRDVLYELELDPASNYSGPNVGGWEEKKGLSLKAAQNELSRYMPKKGKSMTKADYADKNLFEVDGEPDFDLFMETIAKLQSKPRSLQAYDRRLYADAVSAASFKTSLDSEKARQQAVVDALYQGMSTLKNGTMVQELSRADNFMMGMVGHDQLTKKDIVEVLLGIREITTYDNYGRTVTLTREDLGIETDGDLFDIVCEYPSLSKLFVPTTAYATKSGGIGYATSMGAWTVEDEVTQAMMDHPGFGAIVSLFVPHANKNQAKLSDDLMNATRQVVTNLLCMDLESSEMIDLSELDEKLANEVNKQIRKYAAEAQKIAGGRQDGTADWSFIEIDKPSIQSYADVKQTLSGAKTASSTGVEGAMSSQHGILQIVLPYLQDEYMPVTADTPDEIKQQLVGNLTVEGVPYDGTSSTIVYAPGVNFADQTVTTNRNQKRITFRSLWFMLKRMLSGEDHNTKAKKSGDDGQDSISKWGKWDLVEQSWEDFLLSRSTDPEKRGVYYVWQEALEAGMTPEQAIEKVRYRLAVRMKKVDEAMGYKGTEAYGLHNYMNLARTMVVPTKETDEEGEYDTFVIRSLEQISTRLNTVISSSMVDLSSVRDEETASQIRDQLLETCKEEMALAGVDDYADGWDVILGVTGNIFVSEHGSEGTFTNKRVSSRSRNLDTIGKLMAQNADIEIMTKKQLRSLSDRLCEEHQIDTKAIGRGMFLVGVVDSKTEIHQVPGVNNCVLVKRTATDQQIVDAVRICKQAGTTLLLEDPDMVDLFQDVPELAGQVVTSFGNTAFDGVPFFDMLQNGYGSTKSATFQAHPDNFVLVCEDANMRHDYGDSVSFGTDQFLNKKVRLTHNSELESAKAWQDDVTSMFANTIQRYEGCRLEYSMVTDPEEIASLLTLDGDQIDYRVANEYNKADKVFTKFDRKMANFFAKWDGKSPFLSEASPDDCVGFMKCRVRGTDAAGNQIHTTVYAPIIPWPDFKQTARKAPRNFLVSNLQYNRAEKVVQLNWAGIIKDIKDLYFKFHEGFCAANKTMMTGVPVEDHLLPDGTPIDVFVSAETTSGRRLGSNKRRDTMITLLGMTYKNDRWRYNFAEDEGFMPENQDLRERFKTGRLKRTDWDQVSVMHEDPKINEWMLGVVTKCKGLGINPSDVFANKYGNKRVNNFYEFDLFVDVSDEWEDGMLRAFNHIMPNFCPSGIDDASENHLFRCCQGDGWNKGVLQMQVPWKSGNKEGYTWENVYGSWAFFGENTASTERPSLSAADMEYQSLQQVLHGGHGTALDWLKALRYATSGTAPAAVRNKTSRKLEVSRTPDANLGRKDGYQQAPTSVPKTLGNAVSYGFKQGTVDAKVDKWINGEDDQGLFYAQTPETIRRSFGTRSGMTAWESYYDVASRVVCRSLNELLIMDREETGSKPKNPKMLVPGDTLVQNATNKVLHKLGLNESAIME